MLQEPLDIRDGQVQQEQHLILVLQDLQDLQDIPVTPAKQVTQDIPVILDIQVLLATLDTQVLLATQDIQVIQVRQV